MENKELLRKVSTLGFSLFEVEEKSDVNHTLAEVVKSNNLRLWEAFPLLLANAAQDETFNYKEVENDLKDDRDKTVLRELLLVALAYYKFQHLHFDWAKDFYKRLSASELGKMKNLKNFFVHGDDFNFMEHTFSTERLKEVFKTYFNNEGTKVRNQVEKQDDAAFEYALSQVFSPKQKELFLKKVKGLDLNKTEREYFSRRVKKKLFALASPELNHYAKLLLE